MLTYKSCRFICSLWQKLGVDSSFFNCLFCWGILGDMVNLLVDIGVCVMCIIFKKNIEWFSFSFPWKVFIPIYYHILDFICKSCFLFGLSTVFLFCLFVCANSYKLPSCFYFIFVFKDLYRKHWKSRSLWKHETIKTRWYFCNYL